MSLVREAMPQLHVIAWNFAEEEDDERFIHWLADLEDLAATGPGLTDGAGLTNC